jgi:hypothetical protein
MTDQRPSDPKIVWQNLRTEGETMSAQEVRMKAEKLALEIRRDTIAGFAFASALTIASMIALWFRLPEAGWPERIIVTIIAVLLWSGAFRNDILNRRRLPQDLQIATCLEFYRRELQLRRDYFRKAPWIIGTVMLIAIVLYVTAILPLNPALSDLLLYPFALLLLILIALLLWRRQVRRLQAELDALDRFQGD